VDKIHRAVQSSAFLGSYDLDGRKDAYGKIHMSGKYSEFFGLSPWEPGFPERLKKCVKSQITEMDMTFSMN